MKSSSKSERKSLTKTVLSAALIVGASTMAFQGITQVLAEAEYSEKNLIPTSYANYADQYSETVQNSLPEGYKKANYTVEAIDLQYYKSQTPTGKDIAKEDAAEIGAQALWNVFGISLDGQVIEMGYHAANEELPRSRWDADVIINGERSYYFSVDSVTGELFSISRSRTLKENVSVAFDASLDKNPQEYVDRAKETAKTLNIVHGPVASVEYNGQGYSNNDPEISLDIKGENGEIALVTFSRYDKALKGISYHASYKYTLEGLEKIERELHQITLSSVDESKEPTLITIPSDDMGN